jgi:hypothetical protein
MIPLFITITPTEVIAWLPVVAALLKLTHWGYAQSKALDIVVKAVEAAGAAGAKQKTAELSKDASSSVQRAISYAAADADANKENVSTATKVLSVLKF